MSAPSSSVQQQWRERVRRQRASGLTVAAYCRQNRLAESSFFAWKRKLGALPQEPAFVEARVGEGGPVVRPGCRIEVCVRGGRCVRVRRGFDRDLLMAVIAALEGMP